MAWTDPYHADVSRDSHSSLELLLESPTKYAAQRIWGMRRPDNPSWEMLIGSAFDCWLFERAEFYKRYALSNTTSKTTTKREHDDGRTLLTAHELKLLVDMEAGIASTTSAHECLFGIEGESQKVLTWDDAETGLPLKCKADRFCPGLIVDLKTTDDVAESAWKLKAARLGYHRQQALYTDGARACGLICEFVFVVVSREWPFECAVYALPEYAVEAGRRQNRELIRDLAKRKATNDWRSRISTEIEEVRDFPTWALGSILP